MQEKSKSRGVIMDLEHVDFNSAILCLFLTINLGVFFFTLSSNSCGYYALTEAVFPLRRYFPLIARIC